MFSAFSGWVATATDAVKDLSDQGLEVVRQTGVLDALESVSAGAGAGAGGAPQSTVLCSADLMTPPSEWTGSSEEWTWCVEAALRDENTCALTPAALRADGALWTELKATVAHLIGEPAALTTTGNTTEASIATTNALMDKSDGTYAPADDLVQYVQTHHAVYQVRSHVVPRFTADEDYWLNLGWRLAIYRQCTSGGQLLTLMRALSRLPQPLRDKASAAKRTAAARAQATATRPDEVAEDAQREVKQQKEQQEVGGEAERSESSSDSSFESDSGEREGEEEVLLMDNSEYWRDVYVQLEAMQERFTWLRETEERVKKEMELASGNVRLLGSLLQRKDASGPLAASVCDSCQYHKVKLSRLIGDINAAPAEHSAGTALDPQFGTLFQALVHCNAEAKAVLEAYAGNLQGSPTTPKSSATAAPAGAPTSPLASAPKQSAPSAQGVAVAEEPVEAAAPATAPAATSSAPRAPSTNDSSPVELSAACSANGAPAPVPGGDDSGEESFEATLPWAVGD